MKAVKKFEIPLIFLLALLTYYLQSIAWPFTLGRDGGNYLIYYLDILSEDPVYHLIMVMRTPIAPLLYGSLLSLGGTGLTEFILGLIYSGAVLGVYLITRMWDHKFAIICALLVNFYPAYGALYHTISSEAPLAFLFILWCWCFMGTIHKPSVKRFIGLGFLAFVLILTRPTLIAFILYAIVPYILINGSYKTKTIYVLTFAGILIPLVLMWCTYNFIRYDDFTIARTNNAHLPFYRVFLINHTVHPENGHVSAQLARDVENYLLDKEPYRSYRITKEGFFSKSTLRMWGDLIGLSDEIYGWDSDYRQLRQVALEAIYRHPNEYLISVVKSIGGVFVKSYSQPASIKMAENSESHQPLNSDGLPIPTEGDLIPRSYYLIGTTSSEESYKTDPNSLELKILDPTEQNKLNNINGRLQHFQNMLPPRNGLEIAARILNIISICYFPPFLWLVFGMIGLILNPAKQNLALAFVCLVNFLILLYTVLGVPSVIAMRAPFDPLFLLFGLLGIKEIISRFKTIKVINAISGFSIC